MPISRPAGSTPSIVSFDSGVDQYDDQLTTLMEDFVRATQLQISLKKRIGIVMSQREGAARAQEEKARMQLEEAQEKRQQLLEANRLLRLKMEQTESTGNTAPERDTEGDEQVVAKPFTAADGGVVDGNLQNAEPTIQIPTNPFHHSPKQTSALIATPRSAAPSNLDGFAPPGGKPPSHDGFRDEDSQDRSPQSEEEFGGPTKCVTPPPVSVFSFGTPAQPPKPGNLLAFGYRSMVKNPPPSTFTFARVSQLRPLCSTR